MTQLHSIEKPHRLPVPLAPVLVLNGQTLHMLSTDGVLSVIDKQTARDIVTRTMPIVCHAPQIAHHIGINGFYAYDVLELFAFVHPARFAVPTPHGLTRALGTLEPETAEDQCRALRDVTRHLLADLRGEGKTGKSAPVAIAGLMGMYLSPRATGDSDAPREAGWPWTGVILSLFGRTDNPPTRGEIRAAMRVWDKIPEGSVHAPVPPPAHHGVSAQEARDRLHDFTARNGRETRTGQETYTAVIAAAFSPAENTAPAVVMAEAGTGTGKTLGYLAPATVWAEKNQGAVWVSTFTRNLQTQAATELRDFYPDDATRDRKIVTRKGRENYLCLLNLEDVTQSPSIATHERNAIALGLMIRWATATRDGDLTGTDFPGWLPGLIGRGRVAAFADKRGECIYSACPHFDRCFVEKSIRKAKRADIVIANHALVMHQTATAAPDEILPARYIFDEGHHLFDAADSVFCNHLNGTETADVRRWILGSETGGRSRARGLKKRVEDLLAGDDSALRLIDDICVASRALPAPQWRTRVFDSQPQGACETFLAQCHKQVTARNNPADRYAQETPVMPPIAPLPDAAAAFAAALAALQKPMNKVAAVLLQKLEDEAETLSTADRERIRFLAQSITRRARDVIGGWIDMLSDIAAAKNSTDTVLNADTVDWLETGRIDGHAHDTGFYRYALDPAAIFAAKLAPHVAGMAVTSATLRDTADGDPDGWQTPLKRSGVASLAPAKTLHVASPFDYAAQTRILVVRDVAKDNPDEVAAACRALFTASGGGALGIFTAIQRLKAVHDKLAPALSAADIKLYAQHVDGLDTGTLIDIFRAEENACLLGTDATRDGIDVKGRSLRLVVYDRMPWPRPTILHKARRNYFGAGYDDMLTRSKLKQAYGRLIRSKTDRGVFVILDSAVPTRLTTAFPAGVQIERIGLAEAVGIVSGFCNPPDQHQKSQTAATA